MFIILFYEKNPLFSGVSTSMNTEDNLWGYEDREEATEHAKNIVKESITLESFEVIEIGKHKV